MTLVLLICGCGTAVAAGPTTQPATQPAAPRAAAIVATDALYAVRRAMRPFPAAPANMTELQREQRAEQERKWFAAMLDSVLAECDRPAGTRVLVSGPVQEITRLEQRYAVYLDFQRGGKDWISIALITDDPELAQVPVRRVLSQIPGRIQQINVFIPTEDVTSYYDDNGVLQSWSKQRNVQITKGWKGTLDSQWTGWGIWPWPLLIQCIVEHEPVNAEPRPR